MSPPNLCDVSATPAELDILSFTEWVKKQAVTLLYLFICIAVLLYCSLADA